jgi:hypothetical protein
MHSILLINSKPAKTAMVTTAVNILTINPDAPQYDEGTGPIFFKSCGKLYFYLSTPVNVSLKNISINFDLIAYEKSSIFLKDLLNAQSMASNYCPWRHLRN